MNKSSHEVSLLKNRDCFVLCPQGSNTLSKCSPKAVEGKWSGYSQDLSFDLWLPASKRDEGSLLSALNQAVLPLYLPFIEIQLKGGGTSGLASVIPAGLVNDEKQHTPHKEKLPDRLCWHGCGNPLELLPGHLTHGSAHPDWGTPEIPFYQILLSLFLQHFLPSYVI